MSTILARVAGFSAGLVVVASGAMYSTHPESAAAKKPATTERWVDLTDEPSRADLFARFVMPRDDSGKSVATSQSFSLKGPFSFPANARLDGGAPRAPSVFGIDISHYTDSKLNMSLLRQQEIRYVYIKTSQGARGRDPKFAAFWHAVDAVPATVRPLRGAYHFLSSSDDPRAQADSFLALVGAAGGMTPGDMPPVVDLEWDVTKTVPDRWKGQAPSAIVEKALAWLARVKEATGRKPMLYTARSWWRERGIPESAFARFSDYYLWIADYSDSRRATETPVTPGNAKWHLWQFTDRARVIAGYPSNRSLDANIYHGTESEFRNSFGLPPL